MCLYLKNYNFDDTLTHYQYRFSLHVLYTKDWDIFFSLFLTRMNRPHAGINKNNSSALQNYIAQTFKLRILGSYIQEILPPQEKQ